MAATLTSTGQVTIPERIRDALELTSGSQVEFSVNRAGDVVLPKAGRVRTRKPDRFEAARGNVEVRWRTDDLMVLLRGED